MNQQQEKELELEIDQLLKRLPELRAPGSLAGRVISAIQKRRSLRWYNQPWQCWPGVLRVAVLGLLLAMFGGLCVASWQLTRAAGMNATVQELSGMFSGFATAWNTVNVLLGAILVVLKHLGTGFIVGCTLIVGVGYASFIGLGTAYVRLAFARR